MNSPEGWICDEGDAPNESWMSDAPWFKANERHGHRYLIRTKTGISHAFATMAFVKGRDLLASLFYGDPIRDPSQMMGFARAFSTRDPHHAQNAVCVLDGRGTGDALTSLWLVTWGEHAIYMVTPDGIPPNGGGEIGLVIQDWRYVRGPNRRSTFYVAPEIRQKFATSYYRKIFIREVDAFRPEPCVD
jgi:hypothetical protein